jgi:hypothetical protein
MRTDKLASLDSVFTLKYPHRRTQKWALGKHPENGQMILALTSAES